MVWIMARLWAIFRREPWVAEFGSGFGILLWAVLSCISVRELSSWPSMYLLVQLADDRTWNMIAFAVGSAQLVFLLFDQRWLRWGSAAAAGWFWSILGVGMWGATPWAPPISAYVVLAGMNIYTVMHLPLSARRG